MEDLEKEGPRSFQLKKRKLLSEERCMGEEDELFCPESFDAPNASSVTSRPMYRTDALAQCWNDQLRFFYFR